MFMFHFDFVLTRTNILKLKLELNFWEYLKKVYTILFYYSVPVGSFGYHKTDPVETDTPWHTCQLSTLYSLTINILDFRV